jgi:hypothetical protein
MLDELSKLVRKPSKVDEAELDKMGWTTRRNKVLVHMERDQVLQRLLADFKIVNDRLKQIRSTRDVKIYYTELEKAGTYYTYARCIFNVNGKQTEFRKYLGKTDELKPGDVDEEFLKQIFLKKLKNFLE